MREDYHDIVKGGVAWKGIYTSKIYYISISKHNELRGYDFAIDSI